jgi:hypothetical protein
MLRRALTKLQAGHCFYASGVRSHTGFVVAS